MKFALHRAVVARVLAVQSARQSLSASSAGRLLRSIASRFTRLQKVSLVAVPLLIASVSAHALDLVVPAYFDPTPKTTLWTTLAATPKSVGETVILNPNSGPGTVQSALYVAAIAAVHLTGGKVIGYVSTKYGKRSLSDVVKDINTYTAFYKVDGIFMDEMSSDNVTAHVQYYQSIYNYVKGLSSAYTVIGNPGVNTQELYVSLPTADRFVVFEDVYKSYKTYKAATWQSKYASSKFIHMVYNVPADQLSTVVSYAKSHGAGGVFVTSLTLPNPYKSLPTYWTQEASLAKAAN